MPVTSLLIANRGEIAIRIIRGAAELGIRTVAVYSSDDAESLHTRKADEARALDGVGVAAYLNIEGVIATAKAAGCDAIHPGYGFLSENAAFGRRCKEEGITFVGPRPEVLALFGDKVQARHLAEQSGVPVLPGTAGPITVEGARQFFASLGQGAAIMLKAVAAAGDGARAPSNVPRISTKPSPAAHPKRSPPSATATSTPSATSPAPATSKSRSSAMVPAPSATSGSGSAAFSAASKKSSRSRQAPACPAGCGSG